MCGLNVIVYSSVNLKYKIRNERYTTVKLLSKLSEVKMNLNHKVCVNKEFQTNNGSLCQKRKILFLFGIGFFILKVAIFKF